MSQQAILPDRVRAAQARAQALGFDLSCTPETGRFLCVLAATLASGMRALELGSGCGVGTAWILERLAPGVEFVTVEPDPDRNAAVRELLAGVPSARAERGDGLDWVRDPEQWDFIFADAPAGKLEGLEWTVAALRPRGRLVVDDMLPLAEWEPSHVQAAQAVRRTLLQRPDLRAVELPIGTGLILAVRTPRHGAA
jgi:predicted O-methyltransferase YrrM